MGYKKTAGREPQEETHTLTETKIKLVHVFYVLGPAIFVSVRPETTETAPPARGPDGIVSRYCDFRQLEKARCTFRPRKISTTLRAKLLRLPRTEFSSNRLEPMRSR